MGKNTVRVSVLVALAALAGCSDEGDDPGYGTAQLGEPVSETSAIPSTPDDGLGTDIGSATPTGSDVPAIPYCQPVTLWNISLSNNELEVLRLTNLRRQAGARCGNVSYAPAAALTMAPALRCAARVHSKDMSDRRFFSHTAPDGTRFSQRIDRAGYLWRTVGENIAMGYPTPLAVVNGWMQSPGHCANIMNPAFTQIGIAVFGASVWTQDFGAPRR
ncbi:MAG: CAP domain-containing protein [Polyangiales bacterium]